MSKTNLQHLERHTGMIIKKKKKKPIKKLKESSHYESQSLGYYWKEGGG